MKDKKDTRDIKDTRDDNKGNGVRGQSNLDANGSSAPTPNKSVLSLMR